MEEAAEQESSSSTLQTRRLSRLSIARSEGSSNRTNFLSGRRSSILVRQVVGDVEMSKEVVLGEETSEMSGRNPSFLAKKMASVEEEKKRLASYKQKLENEVKQWDALLEKHQNDEEIAKSDQEKPIKLSSKFVEEVRAECLGVRSGPSPLEIALAMVHSMKKKTESRIPQIEQLKAEIAAAEDRYRRLQEAIKIQEKYLNHERRDELLKQKDECDTVTSNIEKWMAKYGLLERLADV